LTRAIRVAVQIPPAGAGNYRQWRDTVARAEDVGVDVILGYEHFLVPSVHGQDDEGRPTLTDEQIPMSNFESWTSLAAWAEMTSRPELGLLVGGAGFRNPDLLADMARTVDHISGGRLILGLGAGWYEPDYREYGYDFGTTTTRHRVFLDALERIRLRLPQLIPPPLRKIPVLIGGTGERFTIPAAARYADIWHVGAEPGPFARKDDVLRRSADEIGRDHLGIERAVKWRSSGSADLLLEAGATLFTVTVSAMTDFSFTELMDVLHWRDVHR
jgi:probable F420-dependent oxidoreductase